MKFLNCFILISLFSISSATKLRILHTNDHHGRFFKTDKNEYGLAAQQTLVKRLRREALDMDAHVLFVSAGDVNTGTPESNYFLAKPDFLAMNFLGVDVMALGNHEFDNPSSVLFEQQKMCQFPFISANIYHKGTNKRVFEPYIIKNYDGLKVGILGLTTEDTLIMANPIVVKDFDFRPVLEESEEMIGKLRPQVDILIVVSHIGIYTNPQACAPDDIALAKKHTEVDFIFGGHSQTKLENAVEIGNTRIYQAHEWGKYVGVLDLEFNDHLQINNYALLPVNFDGGPLIEEDPELLEFLTPYHLEGSQYFSKYLTFFEEEFIGRGTQLGETNLGRLFARALRTQTKMDIGIFNDGGLRTNLGPGEVNLGHFIGVYPFENTMCSVSLTPSEIKNYLEAIASVVHLSGIQVKKKQGKITAIMKDDKNILDGPHKDSYSMVINDFNANGGDKYPKVDTHPKFNWTPILIKDLIIKFLENSPSISSKDFSKPSFIFED